MSTVPNNVDSAAKLLEWAKLKEAKFHNCDAASFLGSVWTFAEEIWKEKDVLTYTDHSLPHSMRIVHYFLEMGRRYAWSEEEKKTVLWSEYEKMIFIAAAMIHDIGMQANFWAPKVKLPTVPQEPMTHEQVRANHVEYGSELILSHIRGPSYEDRFPAPCTRTMDGHLLALHRAAHIAFAHSGKTFLQILQDDTPTWREKPDIEDGIRPRLLAGMLRLCDELDGNYTRIRNETYIWGGDLSDVSKRHWLACHFVEAVEVGVTPKKTVNISIRWRIPETAKERTRELIRNLLITMRESKLNSEIEFINTFFRNCKEKHNVLEAEVSGLSSEPSKFPMLDRENLDSVLADAVEKRFAGVGTNFVAAPSETEPSFHIHLEYQPPEITSVDRSAIPLEQTLKDWYNSNRDVGHFELVSGEHTDTFLHCRTLVSNQELLRALAASIYTNHKVNGIDVIIAVGTSAIPLAVNVAYRLGCSVTFTFNPDNSKRTYHEIELEPNILKGQTTLLIDDVISGGTVASSILDSLGEKKKMPGKVYHQAIFRLGAREYKDKKGRIAEDAYSFFVHEPNVYYKTPNDECMLCRMNIPLKKEVDIH